MKNKIYYGEFSLKNCMKIGEFSYLYGGCRIVLFFRKVKYFFLKIVLDTP